MTKEHLGLPPAASGLGAWVSLRYGGRGGDCMPVRSASAKIDECENDGYAQARRCVIYGRLACQ